MNQVCHCHIMVAALLDRKATMRVIDELCETDGATDDDDQNDDED